MQNTKESKKNELIDLIVLICELMDYSSEMTYSDNLTCQVNARLPHDSKAISNSPTGFANSFKMTAFVTFAYMSVKLKVRKVLFELRQEITFEAFQTHPDL